MKTRISKSKVLTTVDLLKFLCAIMVVGIHAQPFGDRLNGGGYFLTTFFRIAVPFFFVFSSYAFFQKNTPIRKYVKRLLIIDLSWTIIEIPIIISNYFISSDISLQLSCINLLKGLLWGETYLGSWFIHASWMGMLIVYYVSKGPRWMQLVISIFCLIVALLDTSYYFLIIGSGIQNFWNTLNRVICPSESFIVAIPYMFIGKYIADNNKANTSKYGMITLLVLIVALLAEAEVCKLCSKDIIADMANPRYEVFILLPVISYILVKLSISYQIPISNEMSRNLRNMSILIYLFHRISLILIHKIGMQTEGILCFIVSIGVSVAFSVTIIYLSKSVRFVRYLY